MTMEVLNPATGETMAEVPESSVEDVDARSRRRARRFPAGPRRPRASARPRC